MKSNLAVALLPLAGIVAMAATTSTSAPTYYRDVVPIFQEHCQECHRAGEIAPFALTDYKSARPWAKAIKAAVLSRKMPPWFADPHFGHFANDRSLSKAQIDTLAAWTDAGAPEGSAKDAPPLKHWADGWNIPEPDAVIRMPQAFKVPASGEVDYQYIVIPTGFTEDKWIQMAEMRPSARNVVHHVVVFVRPPTSNWLRGEAEPGVPFTPPKKNKDGSARGDIGGDNGRNEILTIFTPGMVPDVWRSGVAKRIPAGSDLVFQIHYTPTGKEIEDQGRIGLIFAKEAPPVRAMTLAPANQSFKIPPGDPNYEVDFKTVLPNGATIMSFFPHMHLRGKGFEYRATYPDGHAETLLKVNYDFHWQLSYKVEKPIELPPGTRLELAAWFDNSANNPWNPDPKSEVRWGEQTREEMMIGFVDIELPANQSLMQFFSRKKSTD
jgi:mono/diheme cytochrome c family protein